MNKVFKMKFSKAIIIATVILWTAIAALLVFTAIDMILFSGFDIIRLLSIIALSAIFSVAIIMLYKSNYKVLPDGIEINISILRYKIDIITIFSVQYSKVNNCLILNYFDGKSNVKRHFVQIKDADFKSFVDELKKIKPTIIYEEET